MNRTASTVRRRTAVAVTTTLTALCATALIAAPSVSATDQERPCFIVQPRWNTALDGPAPTCTGPTAQAVVTAAVEKQPAGTLARYPLHIGDPHGADPGY